MLAGDLRGSVESGDPSWLRLRCSCPYNPPYGTFSSLPWDPSSNGPRIILPFTLRATEAMPLLLWLCLLLRSSLRGGGVRYFLSFGGGAGGGMGVSIWALSLCFLLRIHRHKPAVPAAIRAAAADPTPIPIAWVVLTPTCLCLGVDAPDEVVDVGTGIANVAVSNTPDVP